MTYVSDEFIKKSNSTYLERINSDQPIAHAILPHERYILIDANDGYSLSKKLGNTAEQIHESDYREVKVGSLATLLSAVVIEYPDNNETRATLGSRVKLLDKDKSPMVCDLIGDNRFYRKDMVDDDGREVIVLSTDAPLAREIVGHEVGTEIELFTNSRKNPLELQIVSIDQLAVARDAFKNIVELRIVD